MLQDCPSMFKTLQNIKNNLILFKKELDDFDMNKVANLEEIKIDITGELDTLEKFFDKIIDNNLVSLRIAERILGKDKIIYREQAESVWRTTFEDRMKQVSLRKFRGHLSPDEVIYSGKTLKQCAKENAEGKAKWRLMYSLGLSITEMNGNKQIISPECNWWNEPDQGHWMHDSQVPCYHLINLQSISPGDEFPSNTQYCPVGLFVEAYTQYKEIKNYNLLLWQKYITNIKSRNNQDFLLIDKTFDSRKLLFNLAPKSVRLSDYKIFIYKPLELKKKFPSP